MNELPNVPDGYVAVRTGLRREEALVVQGLMEATGIPSVLVGASVGLHSYTREATPVLGLYVVADRAEEAEELLSQDPFADPGDVGAE